MYNINGLMWGLCQAVGQTGKRVGWYPYRLGKAVKSFSICVNYKIKL
jgi:hypothetical protein